MKKIKTRLILVALVLSLGLNVVYISKNYRTTDDLFEQYEDQLLIAVEALTLSVQNDDPTMKQQSYLSTHRALARARIISEVIGLHNEKYRYDRNGEIYFTIPYEMDWILEYATYSENKEEDLKKVSDIFSVYAKHIREASSLKELSIAQETLRNIHNEIISKNMIPETISMPMSFYKY